MGKVRVGYWLAGVPVVAVLAVAGVVLAGTPNLTGLAGLLGWVLGGLVLELALMVREAAPTGSAGRGVPADARPADGVVEVVPLAGVVGVPNTHDGRFRRFERLGPDAPPARTPRAGRQFPALLGRVVVCSLFVGRDGRGWSDTEIARTLGSLRTACGWIERQASRWGAPVNVELAETYFEALDDAEEGEVELAPVDEPGSIGLGDAREIVRSLASASRAAARLGFADVAELVARVEPARPADVVAWLLHPRRAGRSIAIPADLTELPGVTLAVCYPRFAEFPGPLAGPPAADPATIAHELLHLFGASDKYDRPSSAFAPGSVGERDIMRFEFNTLSAMRVDPMTAVEVGWATKDARPHPTGVGRGRAG